jgi:hypothetical protein
MFVELLTVKIAGHLMTVRKKCHVIIGASGCPVHARPVTDEVAVEQPYLLVLQFSLENSNSSNAPY